MRSKTSSPFHLVREFHKTCDYRPEPTPSFGTSERKELWLNLLNEEVREFNDSIESSDLVGTADAIADIIYVATGAALAFGIPIEKVFAEVHRSNMTKLVSGVKVRQDGKILKGSEYSPPDLEPLLAGDSNE